MSGRRSVAVCDLAPSKVRTGSVFIAHNGVEGVSGHYEATRALQSYIQAMRLGTAVVPKGAKIGGSSSGTAKYDRFAFREKWLSDFPWLRTDKKKAWCYACRKFSAVQSRSKIATGEVLYTGVRQDKLREHDGLASHKKAMAAWAQREQPGKKIPTGLEGYVDITSARDVLNRLVVTVFTIVTSSRPFSDMLPLCQMQEKNGLQMGGGAYCNNTFFDSVLELMASTYEYEHGLKILESAKRAAVWFSGDAFKARSNIEVEVMCAGFFDFEDHTAKMDYFSASEVNYAASEDGKSPDASAIFSTHKRAIEGRFGVDVGRDIISNCTACVSFDGAGVMIGCKDSVASRWMDASPSVVVIHAIAHRLESAYADACSEIPYMQMIGELVQDLYNHLSRSAKNSHELAEVAKQLELGMVKLSGLHGIRWLASTSRGLQNLLRSYVPVAAYLNKTALSRVGLHLNISSPSEMFLNVRIFLDVEGVGKRSARVVRIVPRANGGAVAPASQLSDKFIVRLERTAVQRTSDEYTKTKDEIALSLASSKEESLVNVAEWDLYLALTQYRTVVMLHFLLDLESILTGLSLVFQSEAVTPSAVQNEIDETMSRIEVMKAIDGISLHEFYSKYNADLESYEGFNLEECQSGEENFQMDRNEILTSLGLYLRERFDPLLKSPILTWMRDSFEHRRWPDDPEELAMWGANEIRSFAGHFSGLTSMRDFDVDECLHQWKRLKKEICKEPFFSLSYKRFWEHLSRHYDNIHGYPLVIKLARISLMIMPDTSCCERVVSKYNRIHDSKRPCLQLKTVRNALAVISYGPKSIADFESARFVDMWMGLVGVDGKPGAESSGCAKRRSIAALARKVMKAAAMQRY